MGCNRSVSPLGLFSAQLRPLATVQPAAFLSVLPGPEAMLHFEVLLLEPPPPVLSYLPAGELTGFSFKAIF